MTEKHLLFAVLAFESELLDLAQLTAACRAWAADKSKPLADLLVERGWITADERGFVEMQLERKLAKHQHDPRVTLNAVTRGDVCDAIKEIDDSDIQQSLSSWPLAGPVLIETIGETMTEPNQPKSKYTWISEVGKGGLGKVWLARDNDLGREVALKEIKPGSESSEAVRRLIKEAQITGQLQHPGIVPIYDVQREGRPYYTMKLIKGKGNTLSDAIRKHHALKQAGQADPVNQPNLLNVFQSICEALAYAHSRGVIHRDLKPQNIVLGDFGEVIVLDWGLARSLGSAEEDSAPIVVTEDGQTDATQAGQKLGTPAYMSPEQAAGRVNHMDRRTDIYGLGAILFEILTGQAPHRVQDSDRPTPSATGAERPLLHSPIAALLHRIATEPAPHVRDLDPEIPEKLDAVCAQAMATKRDDRFQTAHELKAALVEYQVHAQSIELTTQATDVLKQAQQTGSYDDFNRARFGFESALERWPNNTRAADGLREARSTYARAAFAHGDYDLALSVLDATLPDQAELRITIQKASTERATRQQQVRRLRRITLATSTAVAVVAIISTVWINTERNAAVLAKNEATKAQEAESKQRQRAQASERDAVAAKLAEAKQRETAEQEQAAALRENANHYWRLAVNIRDSPNPDPIRASYLFLQGAKSLTQIVKKQSTQGDESFRRSQVHAAGAVELGCVRTWAHNSAVFGCLLSRDESRVLAWCYDKTVRLWDVTKPEPLQTFKHDDLVNGAQFSQDESRVLTWSDDGRARLWDVTKSEPLQTFKHDYHVKGAQFSRDESRVLTWSDDGRARLWDVTKPDPLQTFKHDASVIGAQFSRDETRVLTWSNDGAARLWDVTKPEPLQTFDHDDLVRGTRLSVGGAQFSRDESRVLTWSRAIFSNEKQGEARLWDVTKPVPLQIFKHDGNVNGVQLSRDESRVLTWSDDKTSRLWDVTRPEPVQTFKHETGVQGARFSRDESRVLTWSSDPYKGEARLWDVTKPEPLQIFKHDGNVHGVQFSRDESRVLTWSEDKTSRLWDVTRPEPLQTFKHDNYVKGARFSRDESRVLTWSSDSNPSQGDVRLWDVTKADPLLTFKPQGRVYGVQLSRDESRVLTWGGDFSDHGEVRLWKMSNPGLLQTFKHDTSVQGARFSRDESRVLTWGGVIHPQKGEARLWDVTKPEPLQSFKHDSHLIGVQFSRDESRVLTWSGDKTARLWDVTEPEPLQTFKHDYALNGAQFSRDESRVLTWSGNIYDHKSKGEARLWDVTKSEPLQTFKHDTSVQGAQFSRDELRVLTWCYDTARLWDMTKPEPLQTFKHQATINGAQFSRDESRVLTWCHDRTARLWDVTKPEPLQTFNHDVTVNGARFSRDESLVLTWSGREARLWDVTKPEPLRTFKHDGLVHGAQFSRDESRVLTWSADATARLWDVTKPQPLQTFKHEESVHGAQFSRDESRVLTWSGALYFTKNKCAARLWDVTKPEAIQTFNHDGSVNGAQFSRDESRVLTWSQDNTSRLWNAHDPLALLTPDERILELEVRSAKTLDANLKLRTLPFAEWQAKVKSPEYRAIEKHLPR